MSREECFERHGDDATFFDRGRCHTCSRGFEWCRICYPDHEVCEDCRRVEMRLVQLQTLRDLLGEHKEWMARTYNTKGEPDTIHRFMTVVFEVLSSM